MSGQISNSAIEGGGADTYRPEQTPGQAQRLTLRDRLMTAWDRVMAPLPEVSPMPQARFDPAILQGPEGRRRFNEMLTESTRASVGLGKPAIPGTTPNPLAAEYSPGQAFTIGAGAPMGAALDWGKQAGLNARYLAAALRGSPSMSGLAQEVDDMKRWRAANDLAMRRLSNAHPSTAVGGILGDIFTPAPMSETWLPQNPLEAPGPKKIR